MFQGKGISFLSGPTYSVQHPVYVAVPKQSTEYQYWKHTEVSLPVWFFKIYLSSISILQKYLTIFQYHYQYFKNKFKCPKFDYFIVLKRYHFRKCIVINFFHVNCQISHQKCQIVYIIEQNVIYALNKQAHFVLEYFGQLFITTIQHMLV